MTTRRPIWDDCVPRRQAGGEGYCLTHSTAGRMVGLFPLDLVGWELPPAGWKCSVAEERDLIASEVRQHILRVVEYLGQEPQGLPWYVVQGIMGTNAAAEAWVDRMEGGSR